MFYAMCVLQDNFHLWEHKVILVYDKFLQVKNVNSLIYQ